MKKWAEELNRYSAKDIQMGIYILISSQVIFYAQLKACQKLFKNADSLPHFYRAFFLIEVQLLYNVSGIEQSDSVLCRYIVRVCQLLRCVQLFAIPWTVAYQAPLFMEFSGQEYCSRLPSLLQGIFLTQGLNPGLLHCRQIP